LDYELQKIIFNYFGNEILYQIWIERFSQLDWLLIIHIGSLSVAEGKTVVGGVVVFRGNELD